MKCWICGGNGPVVMRRTLIGVKKPICRPGSGCNRR